MRRGKDKRSKVFELSTIVIAEKEPDIVEKISLGDRCESTAGKGAIFECRNIANEID